MFKKTVVLFAVLGMLLAACAPAAAPTAAPAPAQPTKAVEQPKPAEPTKAPEAPAPAPSATVAKATPAQAVKMVLLPKFLGIAVFDQANTGAQEAHAELKNPEKLEFLGPTPENSVAGQIEILTNATT